MKIKPPRLVDNHYGNIAVMLDGNELRGWSYDSDDEQQLKIRMALEYVKGWCDGYDTAVTS